MTNHKSLWTESCSHVRCVVQARSKTGNSKRVTSGKAKRLNRQDAKLAKKEEEEERPSRAFSELLSGFFFIFFLLAFLASWRLKNLVFHWIGQSRPDVSRRTQHLYPPNRPPCRRSLCVKGGQTNTNIWPRRRVWTDNLMNAGRLRGARIARYVRQFPGSYPSLIIRFKVAL